jgi:hypothetical protein
MMFIAMAMALQGAPASSGPSAEARAAVSAWVECVISPLEGPLARGPAASPGRSAGQLVGAAIAGCKPQEDRVRALYVAHGGPDEGNREMDAYIGRTRQRALDGLRQAGFAAAPG